MLSEIKFLVQGNKNFQEFKEFLESEGHTIIKEESPTKPLELGRIFIQAKFPKVVDSKIKYQLEQQGRTSLIKASTCVFKFKGYNPNFRK